MSPRVSALIFIAFLVLVIAFQLCLALGLPWGSFAMGGYYPGVYPPEMRVGAVVQGAMLTLIGAVILSRAGMALPSWAPASRWWSWMIVAMLAVSAVLNVITESEIERLIWGPISVVLFCTSLHVALSGRQAVDAV